MAKAGSRAYKLALQHGEVPLPSCAAIAALATALGQALSGEETSHFMVRGHAPLVRLYAQVIVGVDEVIVCESIQEHGRIRAIAEIKSPVMLSCKAGDMRWPRTLWAQRPVAAAVRAVPPTRCHLRYTTNTTASTACLDVFVSAVASPSTAAEQEDSDSDDGYACGV